ncbi:MAG: RNA methyltransferase [Lentisphaeria bacterium]|nr:RNA methyltransferase [Lentisphaeria bacterium]
MNFESQFISSTQNPRIKNIVKLRNRRARNKQKLFLVEGYRGVRRALDNGFEMSEIYFCPDWFLGHNEIPMIEEAAEKGTKVFEISKEVFEKIAYRDRPEGLLAVAPQFGLGLEELDVHENSLFVVGEGIEKPGNLGTILRSADAAGADAVVVCDACTDLFNPNVVCASVGTMFTMKLAETTTEDFIAWCREKGVQTLATTPHTDFAYDHVDMTGPTAIVMGTEQYGLKETWMEQADQKVLIPMFGQADSLNVATATTLVLFEAVRQRREKNIGKYS